MLDFERLVTAFQVVPHFLPPDHYSHGLSGRRQGHGQYQGRPPIVVDYLKPDTGELTVEAINALRGNAESDRAILMDRRDTSFAGTAEEVTDEEVISAIKSVPCHY